jgi:hypothetical protein
VRRAPAAWAGVAIGVVLLAPPAAARELWRRGEASIDFSGSFLEQLTLTQGTDADDFAAKSLGDPDCISAERFHDCRGFDAVGDWLVPISFSRLRMQLDLRLDSHWSAYVAYDHELLAGRLGGLGAELASDFATPSFMDADQQIVDDEHASWRHVLYRGYVQFESRHFEATVGRQRIPWGVGRLWNPIDRFNAIPPLALQPDQSAGVDAVDLRWLITGFTFLEGVYAPKKRGDDRSYALRLHGVVRDIDYSLMAGVFEEAWALGFDLAANVGGAAARLEFVFTDPERDVWPIERSRPRELAPFVQLVASIDYLFDVGTGVYALLEHLYNGNALGFGKGRAGALLPFFEATDERPGGVPPEIPGPFPTATSPDRFGGSRVVTRSEHLTGLQLGYDLTPEMRVDLLSILDWQGWSGVFYPSVAYSPRDWLEVTIGAQVAVGPRLSEYGDLDPLGFLILQAFF